MLAPEDPTNQHPPTMAFANFDIEVFFDGACPLCAREMTMLRSRDKKQRIRFLDIAEVGFDAASVGMPLDTLMDQIHGRLPDGTLVTGVEVFRHVYTAIGFRPLVSLTRLPGVRQLLDLAYRVFAKNRLRLTGRCANDTCHQHRESKPLSAPLR